MMRTILTAALCSSVWAASSSFKASDEAACHDQNQLSVSWGGAPIDSCADKDCLDRFCPTSSDMERLDLLNYDDIGPTDHCETISWYRQNCAESCSVNFLGEGLYFDAAAGMCREKMCAKLDVSENCRGATGCTSTTTTTSSSCIENCNEESIGIEVGGSAPVGPVEASGALSAETRKSECLKACEDSTTTGSFQAGVGTCTATKVIRDTALNGIMYECDSSGAIEDTFTETGECKAHTRLVAMHPGIKVCDNSEQVQLMGGKTGYNWHWQCGEAFVSGANGVGHVSFFTAVLALAAAFIPMM